MFDFVRDIVSIGRYSGLQSNRIGYRIFVSTNTMMDAGRMKNRSLEFM